MKIELSEILRTVISFKYIKNDKYPSLTKVILTEAEYIEYLSCGNNGLKMTGQLEMLLCDYIPGRHEILLDAWQVEELEKRKLKITNVQFD